MDEKTHELAGIMLALTTAKEYLQENGYDESGFKINSLHYSMVTGKRKSLAGDDTEYSAMANLCRSERILYKWISNGSGIRAQEMKNANKLLKLGCGEDFEVNSDDEDLSGMDPEIEDENESENEGENEEDNENEGDGDNEHDEEKSEGDGHSEGDPEYKSEEDGDYKGSDPDSDSNGNSDGEAESDEEVDNTAVTGEVEE